MNRTLFFSGIRDLFGGRLTELQVKGIEAILDEWDRLRMGDLRWLAYMLATTKHETAHTMQPIIERGPKSYFNRYEGRSDLGNIVKGDGYRFRGRGFVQLTGRANFARAGKELGVDLVGRPDLALDPANATRIMFAGMSEGWFTRKKLGDYFTASKTDWKNARKIINGLDKAETIAGYAKAFHAALMVARTGDHVPPDMPVEPDSGIDRPPVKLPTPTQVGIGGAIAVLLAGIVAKWNEFWTWLGGLWW